MNKVIPAKLTSKNSRDMNLIFLLTSVGKSSGVCPHCNKRFAFLNIHIKEVHLKIKCFKCQFCARRFVRSGNRLAHMRNVHKELFDRNEADRFFRREREENGIRVGRPSSYLDFYGSRP